ncbi:MAG: TIM barrel protein, partial [Oscillospiraceae bacterium]|nr:TIM barrel protein [Oscillospiraceae bacterium]
VFQYSSTSPETMRIAAALMEKDIRVSMHAPYYISMSSTDEEKRLNSVDYLLQSARALKAMGGTRIIFHPGSCGKLDRSERLRKAMDTMERAVRALDDEGLGDMTLCPEVMGKINQLGSLEEVLSLCTIDRRIIPCVDFGHLNARTYGSLKGTDDFLRVVDTISETLKDERYRIFHSHFSRIEWTKGGEKRHWTFRDTGFGPDWEPFLEMISIRGLSLTVICESAGTQTEDAATMMNYLNKKLNKENDI